MRPARVTGVPSGADARAAAILAALFAALAALTWRKWGVPAIDAGHELTAAEIVARGGTAYQDVRYFYGPAGLYALAGALRVFGTSLTTAFGFGLVQCAAILAVFHVLARRLMPVLWASLGTALLMAIAFSGTAFNLVLPHTNSATFGILFLLLMLLALSARRPLLAGAAAGVVGLTRPEFAAVAVLTGGAYTVGMLRDAGLRAALGAAWRLALPALAIAGTVWAAFAATAGARIVFTENLWPVDFLRVTDYGSQLEDWSPLDLESLVSTLARAAIYLGLLAALVAGAARAAERRGAARLTLMWPLLAVAVLIVAGLTAWRGAGVFPDAQSAVWHETTHLLLGMSWLPALGFCVTAVAVVRLLRGRPPLISDAWAFDLALIAAAVALGARAYDAFTAEGSYAPYYAAPLVLLLALLHRAVAERIPAASGASAGALAATAAGVALYALVALYPDQDTTVRTPRGTVVMSAAGAAALQPAVAEIERRTRPGEPILALPADTGLHFMTGRPPALYDVMFLPGLLDTEADERAAITRLRARGVSLAVVGERRFAGYGLSTFGGDYNRLLAGFVRARPPVLVTGSPGAPVGGSIATRSYSLYVLGR